jgi:hypothetical protein
VRLEVDVRVCKHVYTALECIVLTVLTILQDRQVSLEQIRS